MTPAYKLLYDACKEFVRKCESGEACSQRSYRQMKEAIVAADAEEREREYRKQENLIPGGV